jgi:uncharacterized damage-inducible protein DinB
MFYMKENLLQYAGYNQWANKKMLHLLKTKTPELIEKEIPSSFNSIKKTIMHIADAEYIWHCRLTSSPFPDIPGQTGKPIDYLEDIDQLLLDFIASKEESYFTQSTAYKNLKGESFTNVNNDILMHVFNHGTFHRGQVISMLRNAGFNKAIDSTDFIAYARL